MQDVEKGGGLIFWRRNGAEGVQTGVGMGYISDSCKIGETGVDRGETEENEGSTSTSETKWELDVVDREGAVAE
jgi:hypothetical protein